MIKEIYGGATNKRKLNSDLALLVGLRDADGRLYTESTLPDFRVDFFVDRDPFTRVTCSKQNGVFTGCDLVDGPDGEVQVSCAIPAGSFNTQGKLFIELHSSVQNALFPDGVEDGTTGIDTGIIMVRHGAVLWK